MSGCLTTEFEPVMNVGLSVEIHKITIRTRRSYHGFTAVFTSKTQSISSEHHCNLDFMIMKTASSNWMETSIVSMTKSMKEKL